jgi:3-oxoacyl-[acyl-carrier-protein] synthase III
MRQDKSRKLKTTRIREIGFYLPGLPIPLTKLPLTQDEQIRLKKIGQKFFYTSSSGSTELMIKASEKALDQSSLSPDQISMIISAPSLITSYGLEIPSVAIRNSLGIHHAECINISQGCVGIFRAVQLASQFIMSNSEIQDALVVAGCATSTITKNQTHGSFFWSDGAVAILITSEPGEGLHFKSYSEISANESLGAMQIRYGDAIPPDQLLDLNNFYIKTEFGSDVEKLDYIRSEPLLFHAVFDSLLKSQNLRDENLEAFFLPSLGKNRVPFLFQDREHLISKLKTDFRYGHIAGVDVFLFLNDYLSSQTPKGNAWFALFSAAFTAQWAGLLLQYGHSE